MSIEIMSRVWRIAPYSGGTLLVLLALADYADDYGICWPSQTDVAARARLTERQLRTTLRKLEKAGDLMVHAGRGRGNRTIYCILLGLPDTERAEKRKQFPVIISGINFRLSPEKRKLAAQKAEVSDTKKRKFTALSNDDPSEQDAPNPTPIRHGIHHVDPPPPAATENEPPIGGGGGAVLPPEEPIEIERWLVAQGMNPTSAHEFRSLDLSAAQKAYKKLRDQGSGNGAIVAAWRVSPPEPPRPITIADYQPARPVENTLTREESARLMREAHERKNAAR